WAELLGIAHIGVHDNFFERGGHSLLATQVVSRVRDAFGVELPLRALFEAPTVTALAARIDGERRGEHAQLSPILPVPRDRDLPLSFAQQRLWFIDQLEPGRPLYNVPVALRVEGPLDPRVLERCLSEIVGRHETLRTTFAVLEGVAGAPVQVIQPRAPFVLPVVDLSGLPESRRSVLARRLAEEEAGRPFDLSRGPLLRALLLRLAEGDNVTALTMHHVASDGWSMGILVREVAALYAAFAAGRPSPLPELATQYADFAVWQHSWLRGEHLENEISYWRRQLAHLPPRLELPTDRPRPAVQSLRGAVRPVRLPAELTRQAQALSRHEGATLFMLLLAGFQVLLARTSGQQDLAVGSPVAGRNRVEIEGLIGFFVNTLVLRGDLSGNQRGEPSFRELLGRTRETALAAYLHQDVPFEKLVEELAPERSLAQTPLFQAMLVLQNAPMGSLEVQDLRLHPWPVAGTTSKFDLTVTLTEDDGGLSGTAEYATDLFDSTTIDRLIGHFERLLATALEAPERRIAELPLLSEAERGQVLIEWNDTGDTGDTGSSGAGAQELFAAQARRTPDAVAVVYGDGHQTAVLTYAGLAARAGRLARHLRRLGVGPDVLVGLFVERSLDMVVGMLGILQAGGAYVPLDPGYPEQRLAFMLEDTRAPVVLTQEPLCGRLPAGNAEIVLLDGGEVAPHPRPLSHPLPPPGRGAPPPSQDLDFPLSRAVGGGWERGPGGEGLAYVIYTSGSTGRPKGVALSHGALRNLIDWHLATLLGGVRTLQFASVSFDASFHEMFACWGSGGTLVVVTEEVRRDMQALAAFLVEQEVEKAILPVVVLTQLAEVFAGRAELPPLREITTTGERLQTNRAMAALFERLPECAFHNHYGPSETHVATAFTLPPGPPDWQVYPSIGRPIWRSSAHVLEAGLEPGLVPAPVGVPGDLHLGGACVARGYLGRPGLTAERFVPDPFSTLPEGAGGRLYRTGDTVRLGVNGELEYLGRFDDQVKIRGFRIELGEIEAALATHPAVREAIVVVRGEGAARRLVACVIPAEGIQELDGALWAHLRDRLPDYMVPAAFVPVESFPLTPSGKVDRRALALSCPEPREAASAGVAAPLTPAEELLAGIWSEVLGVERVGLHESFFALGGHSLLATQVMSRIRGVFGTDLPVRQLFESPTIAELARAVQQAESTVQAPPILPVPRDRDLPASFAQQRLWLIDQIEPGNPAYNIPLALRLSGEIEPGLLARIFSEVVRRHEALRTTFTSGDDGPVQVIAVIASVEPLELPLLDLSHLPAAEREAQARALALSEARRPFDLQRGPLLRLLLVRLAGTDWLLLLTLHHIVSDGWSLGVLVREVTALHEAFSQGLPSPLPELPVQYADFAAWQRSWLQGEALDAQLGYWRRRLAGAPAVLELPLDRPRPLVQSYRGASCPVVLSLPLSEAIGRLCRQQGVTPFMALLAGWAVLLGRHAGQDDVLVGTPIAGRNRREIESLIGFFVNTLVLRADLSGKPSGNPSLAELLGQVRRTALDAFAHQDLPFERLVEELAPERTLAHTPLFQVQLVLQNAPMGDLAVPGLAISTLGVDSGVAKFDLSLALSESPDGFAGVLAYAVDLFDRSTAERLAARFQALLSGMAAADPGEPLLGLEVLSAAERRQLLVDWSAAEERVSALSLNELVERQAERTPDAVAVIFEEERWSYRDLVRRSREIATSLRGQGVGPGDRVAILDQRSAERVARVLGVLASGATYVAIDSGQPEAWRARILADLAPVRVLGPLPSVALEDHAPAASEPSATGGDLPAYVVYTSGSTGRPKGIVAHHRGAATYLEWVIRNYGLTESDVALQLAPLTFDASLRDTLAPLAAGGRIVIVPEGAVRDPAALLERMEAFGVTCLPSIVPSLLRLLVEEALASGRKVPSLHSLPSLRLILASGEKLHGRDAAAVRKAFGEKVELINQYGPSEATMTSTWYPVTAADERLPALPVGRPAASARVFLLDRALRPVPPGAVGEICLGGPGLAFGYLGQPDRTAEVFIPDPFGTPGDRLYRTGDRGRYRPDGVLELLGRIDLQVKIRGQRVEPGEVEAVLRSHPAVREAVVAAFGEDEPRLAAWLVAEGSGADDLRAFLAERLPASMIPADWVFLDALPLTPHGKVDRARLPAPGRERKAVQAPRDPTELRLVRLWEEILGSRGVGSVGISDNFFALGGHSLAAVRLMAGVRRLFGRQLPLAELFRRPTIEALAELLRHGARDL
ncbi:MAG TPA: amino acid adenylation domain-containing protein, partial [Thermoanaerobaculia bacterium]